jgi:hypothetical protein
VSFINGIELLIKFLAVGMPVARLRLGKGSERLGHANIGIQLDTFCTS